MTPEITIVHKLPKQIVAEDYLKIVLRERPTAFGFAAREGDKIVIENSAKSLMMNEINELQKAFHNDHLLMAFMKADKNEVVLPDDVPPFVVSNGKEDDQLKIFLATMYEGNFVKYKGMDGKHSPEYCVFDAEVYPKLLQLFKDCGKDWNKFGDELRTDGKLHKTLGNYFDKRGAFAFMLPTGDPIFFGENDLGGQYDWGNTTNAHGYKVAVASAPAEEGGVLEFFRRKAKSSTTVTPPTETPATEPAKVDPGTTAKPDPAIADGPTHIKRDDKDVETKEIDGVTYTKMFPPPQLKGNKKAWNLWKRTFNCVKPGALDESIDYCWVSPEFIQQAQQNVRSKDQVEQLASYVSKARRATNVAPNLSSTRESVAEAIGKNAAAAVAANAVADRLPVMTTETLEKVSNKMNQFAGKKNRPSGLDLQREASKWATFSKATGRPFEDIMQYTFEEYKEICTLDPKAGACLIAEMRLKILEAQGLKLEDVSKYATKGEEPKVVNDVKAPAGKEDDDDFGFKRGKSAA